MKRLRHLAFTAQHRGGEQTREEKQQAVAVYDAIAKALRYWDILGLAKYDDLAYEDSVVWLLQYLPEAHDVHSVESLVRRLAEQQGSNQFDLKTSCA